VRKLKIKIEDAGCDFDISEADNENSTSVAE
jgi:hypothetical protein